MFFSRSMSIANRILSSTVTRNVGGHILGAAVAPVARHGFTSLVGLASAYTCGVVTDTVCEAIGNSAYDYGNEIANRTYDYLALRLSATPPANPPVVNNQQPSLLFHFSSTEIENEKQLQQDQDFAIALNLSQESELLDADFALALSLSDHDIQQDEDYALALEISDLESQSVRLRY